MFTLAGLAQELARRRGQRGVPLLVLRLPQFERIAWTRGKRAALSVERHVMRAFAKAARAGLRKRDLIAHEAQSDVFLAAIVDERTDQGGPSAADCRAALQRIAARVATATGLAAQCGWTFAHDLEGDAGLQAAVAEALERGARERQRYDFFAVVGHELRTPLTSIRGYVETLLEKDLDVVTTRRFLETARHEALRMGRLLESMFEFSLLEFSPAPDANGCDPADAATAAREILAPLAIARGVEICNDIGCGIRLAVNFDACLQALVNLLDNAVKYCGPKGVVRMSVAREGRRACIAVDDNGAGIAARDRRKIFGLRVRGAAATTAGAGIGLAIVMLIAQRAGGDVRVTDSPLGGARFELCLPLKAEFAEAVS